jgi:hypothetical protein
MQADPDRDLALLHHPLPVLLAVRRAPAAALDDVDVVEEEVDPGLVEVGDAGVADRGEDPPRFGSLAKNAVLTSGEWPIA